MVQRLWRPPLRRGVVGPSPKRYPAISLSTLHKETLMTDPQPQPAQDPFAIAAHYGPQQSAEQANILAALFAFQQAVAPIKKDQVNDHLHSKYTDLTGVWAAIREPLKLHELLVIQENVPCSRGAMVATTVVHMPSKEWRASTIYIPARKADAQAFGSAISYARRYGLMTVLGLLTTDDDGHAATIEPPARPEVQPTAPPPAAEAPAQEFGDKGWVNWGASKMLQLQACKTSSALAVAWSGMQPELKKAPDEVRFGITSAKDQAKAKLAGQGSLPDLGAPADDVPF